MHVYLQNTCFMFHRLQYCWEDPKWTKIPNICRQISTLFCVELDSFSPDDSVKCNFLFGDYPQPSIDNTRISSASGESVKPPREKKTNKKNSLQRTANRQSKLKRVNFDHLLLRLILSRCTTNTALWIQNQLKNILNILILIVFINGYLYMDQS